jgi:hypothetical protein
MITKVSYRLYASGVNNIQNQPQKVNFGIRSEKLKLSKSKLYKPTEGELLFGLLCHAYSAGVLNAKGEVKKIALAVLTILQRSDKEKLVSQMQRATKKFSGEKLATMFDVSTITMWKSLNK